MNEEAEKQKREQIVITSQEQFLGMCNGGRDFSVGNRVADVKFMFNVYAPGAIEVLNGHIFCSGCLHARGSIYAGRGYCVENEITSGGSIHGCGDLFSGSFIEAEEEIGAGGSIFAGGHIVAGKYVQSYFGSICAFTDIVACGRVAAKYDICTRGFLRWSHSTKPRCRRHWCKAVLVAEWQWEEWFERLGWDRAPEKTDAYYKNHLPLEVDALLERDDWHPVERWMLETFRDNYTADPPGWVLELEAEAESMATKEKQEEEKS